jgi:hypothetical protein
MTVPLARANALPASRERWFVLRGLESPQERQIVTIDIAEFITLPEKKLLFNA